MSKVIFSFLFHNNYICQNKPYIDTAQNRIAGQELIYRPKNLLVDIFYSKFYTR